MSLKEWHNSPYTFYHVLFMSMGYAYSPKKEETAQCTSADGEKLCPHNVNEYNLKFMRHFYNELLVINKIGKYLPAST